MAITTYQLLGNPSNVLPYAVANGSVTEFDTTTGIGVFVPTNNFIGVTTFQYYILCDSIVQDVATVSTTVAMTYCRKSVKVDICCGDTPLSFKVKEAGTNAELFVRFEKKKDRYCIYYDVPDDGLFHNFILGVFDSSNALIAIKNIFTKRCKCTTPIVPVQPRVCNRPSVGCHVEPIGTIINWNDL